MGKFNTKQAIDCGGISISGTEVITSAGAIVGDIQATAGSIGTTELADASVTPAKTLVSAAVVATDTGATTGTISDTATFVTVDNDSDANHIVVLPTPTPGREVWIAGAADGAFELRSSAPATVAINGGTGATAESAIAITDVLVRAFCSTATTWIVTCFAAAGTESAADAAA